MKYSHDNILVKLFITQQNQIAPKLHYIFKGKYGYEKYTNIKEYIETRYNDSTSYQETIKRMQYHIDTHPICPVCSKPLQFLGKKEKLFATYCSNSCRSKDISKNYWINGQKKYNLEHYGVEHNFQRNDVINKRKQTLLEKYGTANLLSIPEFKEKTQQTLYRKYGVNNFHEFSSLFEIQQKKNDTTRLNNTFNTSKDEILAHEILCEFYGEENVKCQYRSEQYPFNCDFYIVPLDLYIEYNGSHYHHGHPFDETNIDDINELNKLKTLAENSARYLNGKKSQYDNIIYTWTDLDVRKRNMAYQNNLNFIEFWSIDMVLTYFLIIPKNDKLLYNEYEYFRSEPGKLSNIVRANNIVKYFQQDTFYADEKKMYYNDITIQKKLIKNRLKYLSNKQLTSYDLLNGFKRSGIHYGYSHFNPLLFKWFINKYNVKKCYDPCGGWGHRLLGSSDLDLYIYNDLSKHTKENIDNMIEYFNITNAVTYCEDATTFRPTEEYDAMFTCPPYYNLEHYECGDFESIEEYNKFINGLFDCFYKSNSKTFGLVIREDCLEDKWKSLVSEKYDVSLHKAEHIVKGTKHHKEYLYVFKK